VIWGGEGVISDRRKPPCLHGYTDKVATPHPGQALRQSALLSQRENEKTLRLKERLAKYTEYELEDVDNTGHCQFDAIAHQARRALSPLAARSRRRFPLPWLRRG
jgi:hypothetical protein